MGREGADGGRVSRMTGSQLQEAGQFDDALAVGQRVKVRWTSSGRYFGGPGEVVKVNTQSVRVKLLEPVGDYPTGREITAPRFMNIQWSKNNCVRPLSESELHELSRCGECGRTPRESNVDYHWCRTCENGTRRI